VSLQFEVYRLIYDHPIEDLEPACCGCTPDGDEELGFFEDIRTAEEFIKVHIEGSKRERCYYKILSVKVYPKGVVFSKEIRASLPKLSEYEKIIYGGIPPF
jgi:hypothetical protein